MTPATRLLTEIQQRGASVSIRSDRLRIEPAEAVADLEPEIRAHAWELAEVAGLLPSREALATLTAPARDPEPAAAPGGAFPLRVVVVDRGPLPPIGAELRPGVRVADPELAVRSLLGDLEQAVQVYAETCADGGDDRLLRLATEAGEDIERAIEDLEKLGLRVRVEPVQ